MNGIFRYEGILNQTLCKIGKCMFLAALWLITALPVFTIGAANTALAYSVKKVREDQYGVWKPYWKSFRQNFRQATVTWGIIAIIHAVLILSCYCAYSMYSNKIIGFAFPLVTGILTMIIVMCSSYVFPSIAYFTNSTKMILKNCIMIAMLNFYWTLLLVLLSVATILGSILIPMGFLVVPALTMLGKSWILDKVFKKYMPREETIDMQPEER